MKDSKESSKTHKTSPKYQCLKCFHTFTNNDLRAAAQKRLVRQVSKCICDTEIDEIMLDEAIVKFTKAGKDLFNDSTSAESSGEQS